MRITAVALFTVLVLAAPVNARAAPTGGATAPPGVAPAITLNFEQADVQVLIQAVSEFLGINYVLAPDVRGPVTVRTVGAIPRDEAFAVLLSILEPYGFTAVQAGQLYKFVRTEMARERAIPTFITPPPPPPPAPPPGALAPPAPPLPPDQPVTKIIVLRHAAATTLAAAVRPLVSSRGRVVAPSGANVLVVTDTAANVAIVEALVARLDTEAAAETVQVIRLQYADAQHVASILGHVFATGLASSPVIVPDRRTNSLVIRARRDHLESIRRLLGHD